MYCFLDQHGKEVNGFVVKDRNQNQEILYNKKVYEVSDDKRYECVALYIRRALISEVQEELSRLDKVGKLIIVSPCMYSDLYGYCRFDGTLDIKNKAYLSDDINIEVDDNSEIVIEEDVVINNKVSIKAYDNLNIIIKKGSYIGENVRIVADKNSSIDVSSIIDDKTILESCNNSQVWLDNNTHIFSEVTIRTCENSIVEIGKDTNIREYTSIVTRKKSKFVLGDKCLLQRFSRVGLQRNSIITIGNNSTLNDWLYIGADNNSQIRIGEDNMLSYFVHMNVGSHALYFDNCEISKSKLIRTGNHVWIGMNAILLPGTDIGAGSVVGAGAIVNSAIGVNVTCLGIPAHEVRSDILWERNNI